MDYRILPVIDIIIDYIGSDCIFTLLHRLGCGGYEKYKCAEISDHKLWNGLEDMIRIITNPEPECIDVFKFSKYLNLLTITELTNLNNRKPIIDRYMPAVIVIIDTGEIINYSFGYSLFYSYNGRIIIIGKTKFYGFCIYDSLDIPYYKVFLLTQRLWNVLEIQIKDYYNIFKAQMEFDEAMKKKREAMEKKERRGEK